MQPCTLSRCGAASPRACAPLGKIALHSTCTTTGDVLGEVPDERAIFCSPRMEITTPKEHPQSKLSQCEFSELQQCVLQHIANGIAKDVARKARELTNLDTELPRRFNNVRESALVEDSQYTVDKNHGSGSGSEPVILRSGSEPVMLPLSLKRNEHNRCHSEKTKVKQNVVEQNSGNDHNEDHSEKALQFSEEDHDQTSEDSNEFSPVKYSLVSHARSVRSVCTLESGERESMYDHCFELKVEWQRDLSIEEGRQVFRSQRSRVVESTPWTAASTESVELGFMMSSKSSRFVARGVASPTSPSRLAWEIVGLILISYDLIHIPLLMTFPLPATIVFDIIDWTTLLFWTANIPASMLTGFFAKGVLVVDIRSVVIHYLKTWFAVDIFTVVNHWFLTISRMTAGDDHEVGNFANLLKLVRFMRLARLLRLFKLGRLWDLIHDFTFGSQTVEIILEVAKMLLALMMVIHFTACLWYLIGDSNTTKNWIKYHEFALGEVEWTEQYMVAYHWSLTQFTPASMHVQPQNISERIFAIFVVMSGLVGFSYLVGSINLSLGRLRLLGEQKSKKFRQLRHFLKQNRVPLDLSTRIRNYAEGRWDDQQTHRKEANVALLSLLSEHLKSELAWALRCDHLRTHPLFSLLETSSSATMKRIAYKVITQLSMAPGDVLFVVGELATRMSLLTVGTMEYFRPDKTAPDYVESITDVIAEPVVWTVEWHHRGDLRSTTSTELLMMNPIELLQITMQSPVAYQTVKVYARRFVQMLNEINGSSLSDISTSESVMLHMRSIADVSNSLGSDWTNIGSGRSAERARGILLNLLLPGGLAGMGRKKSAKSSKGSMHS